MKILCVMFKYDYGQKSRGYSFEYNTFYKFFEKSGYEVALYDLADEIRKVGKKKANEKLKKILNNKVYDLAFCVPFTNQLDSSVFNSSPESRTPFIAWMCDDKWRWEAYGKNVCWMFDYVVTTDPNAVKKYERIGYNNIILSQWGFDSPRKVSTRKEYLYDVTFVGQVNPWRKYVVDRLRKSGVNIKCFGFGWEGGRVNDEEMKSIFSKSRINLNISNSVKWDLRYLMRVNFDVDKSMDMPHRILNMFPLVHTLFFPKKKEDIKARFFEVTGCGGFLLSYDVENLGRYFNIGKEIVCYKNVDDLIKKIKYFLRENERREKIASSGYSRTKKEHTYSNRFNELFSKIGLDEK